MEPVTHEMPSGRADGSPPGLTPCCWLKPTSLPLGDRLTARPEEVTCRRIEPTVPGVETMADAPVHIFPSDISIVKLMDCCRQMQERRPGELMTPYGPHVTCPGDGRDWPVHPQNPRVREQRFGTAGQ